MQIETGIQTYTAQQEKPKFPPEKGSKWVLTDFAKNNNWFIKDLLPAYSLTLDEDDILELISEPMFQPPNGEYFGGYSLEFKNNKGKNIKVQLNNEEFSKYFKLADIDGQESLH